MVSHAIFSPPVTKPTEHWPNSVLFYLGNSLRCHTCYSAKSWDDCVKNSVILECSNRDPQEKRNPSEFRCTEVFTSRQTKNGQQLDNFAKLCTTWVRTLISFNLTVQSANKLFDCIFANDSRPNSRRSLMARFLILDSSPFITSMSRIASY